jgi:hypothetical protein
VQERGKEGEGKERRTPLPASALPGSPGHTLRLSRLQTVLSKLEEGVVEPVQPLATQYYPHLHFHLFTFSTCCTFSGTLSHPEWLLRVSERQSLGPCKSVKQGPARQSLTAVTHFLLCAFSLSLTCVQVLTSRGEQEECCLQVC